EPTGETFAVGIVTTAIGCQALFGIQPSRIRGKAADLEAAWPEATGLRSKLLRCDDPEHMLDVLHERLSRTSVPEHPSLLRCERAVELLEGDPTRPISEIAAELGVSHSHLDREMARIVGLSPRALARLLRMRRLLALIDVNEPIDWAGLAAQFGWFDQSHFIRDFKRHTGVAPSQYVVAQRTHFTENEHDAAAGFVPES
ncbi:MAG: AraC family transcriptional regulator, partial [Alphaproteobacteria bacterium]|nr:AraC family transcriptional regulator [Alphaproteobacteria bacterium]